MTRRALIAIAALALGGGVVGIMAYVALRPTPPAGFPPRDGAPGIVLLCLDTLRADGQASMPALDAFAKGGAQFADATSGSSWTAPSVATLLTGFEPAGTGVRGPLTAGALVGSVATLAEMLKDRGFSTAAYTAGGWVSKEGGFAQGFDAFSTAFDSKGPEACLVDWRDKRPAETPFFLFLHTCAAHDPYGPKDRDWTEAESIPEVRDRAKAVLEETKRLDWKFARGAAPWVLEGILLDARARASMGYAMGAANMPRILEMAIGWIDGEGIGTPELHSLVEKARVGYRRGLSTADDVLRLTLAALDSLHLPEGTVIAVVGDHGECLGEHGGKLLHGRWLYDELVRVPLAIRAPGRLPAGTVVRGSCGVVDVTPTLLDLAGVKPPAGIDGRSLVPLAKGEAKGHAVFSTEDRKSVEGGKTRLMRLAAVRTEAAKAILTVDPRTAELVRTEVYDLAADPGESNPLPAEAVERFGPEFAAAVESLRSKTPGSKKTLGARNK